MIFALPLPGLFLTEADIASLWVSTRVTEHLGVGTAVTSLELVVRRQTCSSEGGRQESGVVGIGEADPRNGCAVKQNIYSVAGQDDCALKWPPH